MRKLYPIVHCFHRSPSLNSSPFLHLLNQSSHSFLLQFKGRQLSKFLRLITPHYSLPHFNQIHAQIILSGFHSDLSVTNLLLVAYSKSGFLSNARQLFDKMSDRNLISWSAMVSMYSRHGLYYEVLLVFLNFRRLSHRSPNEYLLASVFGACGNLIDKSAVVKQMHSFVLKAGFYQQTAACLVDMYTKNGEIDEARAVLEGLSGKNAFTLTTLIKGYVKSGRSHVSLQMFRETDVIPDKYVLSSVLSACTVLQFVKGGKEIHAYVMRMGIELDVSFVNVLVDFYAKSGEVEASRKVFDRMMDRNAISWTSMIAGYMQNSMDTEAVKLFCEMTRSGFEPDGFSCSSVLTSCSYLESLELGRQVHCYCVKSNVDRDVFVKNSLMCMYVKCSCLNDARRVFDDMADHNVISYNTLIEGYSRSNQIHEAIDLFSKMRHSMLQPSLLTMVSLLCASPSLQFNQQVHALVIKFGFSSKLFGGSALIDVYSKCLCLVDARLVFDEMNQKDIVTWNAMFSGYIQHSENEAALKLFSELQISELEPNGYTFATIITAASYLSSLCQGQQLHSQTIKTGFNSDPFVVNSTVDMYAKCGSFEDARKAFVGSTVRDTACWNAMISAYAHHGKAREALLAFESMIGESIEPDYVTFIGVLSACSHAGLVEEGLHYFKSMSEFGIEPGTEHYVSLVSLLGKAGQLYEAKEFIEQMKLKPTVAVWRSLLSECQNYGNFELGKYAGEMAISVDVNDSGSYALVSNVLASNGMWGDVKEMREKMDLVGVVKEGGHSWIELGDKIHVFVASDTRHCERLLVYSVVHHLILQIREACHLPDVTSFLLYD